MELGFISRRIGLGDYEAFKNYSNIDSLINEELAKTFDFNGSPTISGDIERWPKELTFNLDQRIERLVSMRKRSDELDNSDLPDSEFKILQDQNHKKFSVADIDKYRFFHSGCFSSAQVKLRLSYFWLNHFTVGDKDTTKELIGDYWGHTIINGIDGSFRDLLFYATCHPSMLTYLDNIHNVGPNSREGKKGKGSGLNDNLAREVLELHTVSPSANYTETDIKNCAMILSGWGNIFDKNSWKTKPKNFREPWDAQQAEPGTKIVFGKKFPPGPDGLRKLTNFLANHPKTIEYVSEKLVTHFCGAGVSTETIDEVKTIWTETNGDLPKIHKAVLTLAINSRSKAFLWPQTWLFQALRISQARLIAGFNEIDKDNMLPFEINAVTLMREMGQDFWSRRQPNGFSDKRDDWISTEHLDRRIRLAGLIYDFGKPQKNTDEILSKYNFSDNTIKKLYDFKDQRSKFIATLCSMDMMEV
tara:strand:+ start:164 stop:1582 length:1419 start_codon:yes stop_codon:yes gene_type:complete